MSLSFDLPRMTTIELLAKIGNVRTEVSKHEICLLDILELYSSDTGYAVNLGDHWFNRKVFLNLIVKF
jgi:hypothetical protein